MGFCQSCGAQADPSATFCHNCGQPLRQAGPPAAAVVPAPQQVSRAPQYAQMPSFLTGDGLELVLFGFVAQFFGIIIALLGSSVIAAQVLGVIVLLAGYGMLLYGLNLFRGHYRSRGR